MDEGEPTDDGLSGESGEPADGGGDVGVVEGVLDVSLRCVVTGLSGETMLLGVTTELVLPGVAVEAADVSETIDSGAGVSTSSVGCVILAVTSIDSRRMG